MFEQKVLLIVTVRAREEEEREEEGREGGRKRGRNREQMVSERKEG